VVVVEVVFAVTVGDASVAATTFTEAVTPHVAGLVAPVGIVVTAQVRLTVPVNPFAGVTVIIEVSFVIAPAATVMPPPLLRLKVGVAAAETVTVTAFEVLPLKLASPP
jgi:hypothetical protein